MDNMNPDGILRQRILNQQIDNSALKTVQDLVSWMGAMQAQDFSMSKWAVGIRLAGSTEKTINDAIDSGAIIRTHLLRPTWHLVSSKDLHWMLDLTGPRIKVASGSRDKQLELTDEVFRKTNRIIEKALKDHQHKTRDQLVSELLKSGIRLDDNRAAHILMRAEIEGVICSGRQQRGKHAYTLLSDWVPGKSRKMHHDEALKELGWRYFNSRGPASIEDFTWWSGLTVRDSKIALELNKQDLHSWTYNNMTYWFPDSSTSIQAFQNRIDLLPAYDEFLIGYSDRSASLPQTQNKNVVSINGIFYPAILMNGQVVGTWKRNAKKDTITLTIRLFSEKTKISDAMLAKSVKKYSEFINKNIEYDKHFYR